MDLFVRGLEVRGLGDLGTAEGSRPLKEGIWVPLVAAPPPLPPPVGAAEEAEGRESWTGAAATAGWAAWEERAVAPLWPRAWMSWSVTPWLSLSEISTSFLVERSSVLNCSSLSRRAWTMEVEERFA